LIKMRWLNILWVKLTAGILGIGAGLSLGREGPSIQLGAVAAQGVSRMLKRTRMEERYLMTSGASAGLAAAFNAPLAGVIFALEELHRNFSIVVLLPCMAAAMTATVVSRALFGRASIFEFTDLPLLPINYYGIVVIVALVVGLGGVIFNKGLLGVPKFYALPIFKKPVHKITFALLTAGVLGYFLPEVLGGGNQLINHISGTPVSLQLLLLFLVGKLLFTLISYGCGVPGGFFLPMLVIGALCGSICSNILISLGWIEPAYASNIIVIGMAALFSSSVRAPITGTVLIMEMTSSYQHLLALSIAAMVAFVVAELCKSKPIYEELLNRTLNKAPAEPKLMEQRNITELAVCSGSPIENKLVKEIKWPPNTLLVDIKRGEEQLVPAGDTKIMAGDFIYVLSYNENVVQLQKLASEKEN
ncbi:MAG: ClC family H(+)/Cl(-) exchange transporter, partial [Phascolarctobacterium sp.]|nr:ClC family H(+)/Cl(-) exchange transporter [Phascolarctobacterium sp.]